MKRIVVESPFAGNTTLNLRYLRACLADCLRRGEAPFASHGLYTQPGVLDDGDPEQRKLGIAAGFTWRVMADATAVYTDLGVSRGMLDGIKHAQTVDDHAIEFRELGGDWSAAPSNADDDPVVLAEMEKEQK